MKLDAEIQSMSRAWAAIQSLDSTSRIRVIEYLSRRVQAEMETEKPASSGELGAAAAGFPELGTDWRVQVGRWIAAGKLNKISDRIVVIAALLQWEHPGRADFLAKEIHRPLKDLNAGINNISAHLNSMAGRESKNRLLSISKTDRETGHKRYHLTDRGVREARAIIEAAGD